MSDYSNKDDSPPPSHNSTSHLTISTNTSSPISSTNSSASNSPISNSPPVSGTQRRNSTFKSFTLRLRKNSSQNLFQNENDSRSQSPPSSPLSNSPLSSSPSSNSPQLNSPTKASSRYAELFRNKNQSKVATVFSKIPVEDRSSKKAVWDFFDEAFGKYDENQNVGIDSPTQGFFLKKNYLYLFFFFFIFYFISHLDFIFLKKAQNQMVGMIQIQNVMNHPLK